MPSPGEANRKGREEGGEKEKREKKMKTRQGELRGEKNTITNLYLKLKRRRRTQQRLLTALYFAKTGA